MSVAELQPLLVGVGEAAKMLGVSEDTIRRRVDDGTLPSQMLGQRRLIPIRALELLAAGEEGVAELDERREQARRVSHDPVAALAEKIGISERVAALRPDLAERFEVVSGGEHFGRFTAAFCRHHERVPNGPEPGSPVELEPFQREFFDEALAVEDGRRVYSTAALVIPRKNGKTTIAAALALYLASPADGEERPEVYLAAGSKKQAGQLFDHAKAFIDDRRYGSAGLRAMFEPLRMELRCPLTGGKVERVAGDGDNNHSLGPHAVIPDELHTWKTPKQRENWKAMTTGDGNRLDPLVLAISTEGEGEDNELAGLLARVEDDPGTEKEPRRPGLTVLRNRDSGILIYVYAVSKHATLEDLDEFVDANPAPWRTRERIARDLANPRNDAATKLRLYGNKRASRKERWISDEDWDAARDPHAGQVADGSDVCVAVDVGLTSDSTAVAWATVLDDGRIAVNCRVFAAKEEIPHHSFHPGRIDLDAVEAFIAGVVLEGGRRGTFFYDADDRDAAALAERFQIDELAYDPRFFEKSAQNLDEAGLETVPLWQNSQPMADAYQAFYDAVVRDRSLVHDGDPVLAAHVANAAGVKTERGWKVSKLKSGGKIDALVACVMAVYRASNVGSSGGWVIDTREPEPDVEQVEEEEAYVV